MSGNIRKLFLGNSMVNIGILSKNIRSSLSQIFHDMKEHDRKWYHPLIRHYINLRPGYRTEPYYRIGPYNQILGGFHRTLAMGATSRQKTVIPPVTWSCPTLGLARALMLWPISPKLVLCPNIEARTWSMPYLLKIFYGNVSEFGKKVKVGNRIHFVNKQNRESTKVYSRWKVDKDMASSRNLVSTIGAQASPTMGTEPGVGKGKRSLLACHNPLQMLHGNHS